MSIRSDTIEDAWSSYLSEYDFDMFVTTKYPKVNRTHPRVQSNLDSIRRHEKYLSFVSSKCFGTKALTDSSRSLIHVTFFEDMSKYGEPTIFHAHTLINTRGNFERVKHYLEKEWKKVRPFRQSPTPDIEKSDQHPRLGRYCSKQSNNEYEFLANIPLPHFAVQSLSVES